MASTISNAFKALGDPTRRAILGLLQERDLTAGEIASHFEISKPSISHHLNQLKAAGLVSSERQGQTILYRLETTVVQDLMCWLMDLNPTKEDSDA